MRSTTPGEYGITMRFLDPLTGEEVTSDLLDGAVFTAELVNGGEVQTIDSSTTSVNLKEGEVELNASAELPGHVTVSSSHTYTVYPEPIRLDVSAQIPGDYKLSALGPDAEPILVTVTNFDTGEKLSQEEWDAVDAGWPDRLQRRQRELAGGEGRRGLHLGDPARLCHRYERHRLRGAGAHREGGIRAGHPGRLRRLAPSR